jgi:vitamin B12 transporter
MCNKNLRRAAAAAVLLPIVSVSLRAAGADSGKTSADSLEQVVVTATRANEGIRGDLLGSSFTILEPYDLEQRQTRIVSDILRDVPGVAVSRTGTVGGTTQVRLRGAEGNHTLVLIDGMKASDPYYGEFDFATLMADEVARVEVLRGQQSALYGSDAIGGVINYITLSGREAPGVRARVEGGSFGSVDASARAAGVSGPFDYALSAGYQSTDGVPTSRFGTRDIGASNSVASARFAYSPTDTFRLKAVARYSRTRADLNDQDFNFPPGPTYGFVIDSDDFYKNRALYGLVRGELDALDGHWTHALQVQGVDARRDSFSGGAFDFGDDGGRLRYSYESTLRFGSEAFAHTLTGALDVERENFQNRGPFLTPEQSLDRHITNKGVVVQYEGSVNDRIGFGAALRHDDNDRFDNDNTYRVQGSYRFDGGLRLRAAAGSGIKNPGIFEIFGFDPGTFIGNPDLKPEKSHGWEVGAEQRVADNHALVGVTYFHSKLTDEIFTDFLAGFVSTPRNRTTDSTQRGVEVFGQARLAPSWRVDASYTYLHARENGVEEVRRPPHIASLNIGWRTPEDRGGVDLTVRYNGSTLDNNFTLVVPDPLVRLPSYTLVNLGADWKVTKTVQIYGRVENLLDENYEEVFTYRTAGRGGFFGVRLAL